jgi:hypothetical protein
MPRSSGTAELSANRGRVNPIDVLICAQSRMSLRGHIFTACVFSPAIGVLSLAARPPPKFQKSHFQSQNPKYADGQRRGSYNREHGYGPSRNRFWDS